MFYILCGYLIGSFPTAIIISKILHLQDPRTFGSNNPGATNMLRGGNKLGAALTLIGDLFKGLALVLIAKHFAPQTSQHDTIVALTGVAVVLGHILPMFFKFKGGKGVATSLGVMLAFSPYLALILAITWIIVFIFSKTSSLAALSASILAPFYAYFLLGNSSIFGAVVIITLLILIKHRKNIVRIFSGNEHKFK